MGVLGLVGGAVGGPVGAAASAGLTSILSSWFGGNQDAKRQARVDWFRTQALAGSPSAMRVILAAPANVAGNEDPMWMDAASVVRSNRPDVVNAAYNMGGPYWDPTDNETSDKMRALVNAEIATIGTQQGAPPAVSTTNMPGTPTYYPSPSPTVHTLPGMITTAAAPGMNLWVVGIVALVVLVGAIAMLRRH